MRLIADAISDGQRAGELRADLEPPIIARALFGALDEIALAWLVRSPKAKEPRIDLERAIDQLSTLFIEGLKKKE